jgi:hypothetical protein
MFFCAFAQFARLVCQELFQAFWPPVRVGKPLRRPSDMATLWQLTTSWRRRAVENSITSRQLGPARGCVISGEARPLPLDAVKFSIESAAYITLLNNHGTLIVSSWLNGANCNDRCHQPGSEADVTPRHCRTSSSGDVMGKLPPIIPNLLLYF